MGNVAKGAPPPLCNPGRECFRCRYSDCRNKRAAPTHEEAAMLECAGLKSIWAKRGNWIARTRRKKNV